MSLAKICNREVVIVENKASIQEAAALMRQYHVGCLVVTEQRGERNFPIGILTDRDIVIELIAKAVDLAAVTVGDVSSGDLKLAGENDDVIDTLKQMRYHGIRRMPVVDEQGALVGLITLDDLLELLAEQLKDLAGLISKEQHSEKQAHP
ncbi:CBS domain-containing protein [Methylomarinum sp. Ch1-1]|uniref:CBS domain-containing protein n=1 Tax=Methylomarinum roseum TaxID=3067653 RepID=A0AAU7NZ16_9GAMM|nr:CBS domain-containing protein [Methylomarinum sp. Ch1-1]MDP4521600.1 CBS domain-containing protein [Methylomarinum sp. Ch1-1]